MQDACRRHRTYSDDNVQSSQLDDALERAGNGRSPRVHGEAGHVRGLNGEWTKRVPELISY